MIKLIATDMDGTLLDSNKQLSPDFPEIFEKLKQDGVVFVAASGRSYPKQREIFEQYLDDIYFICDNGASIIYRDEWLYQDVLPKENLHKLIRACEPIQDTMPILCGANYCYYQPLVERFIPRFSSYFKSGYETNNLYDVTDDILKVAICDLAGSATNAYPKLIKALGDEFNIVVSGDVWLDAMNPNTNKGTAIRFLQKRFQITPDETMAFGDFYNDIEMLKQSKYSFVMKNANYDMRQYAKYLAESNDENGVIKAICQHVYASNCVF